MDVIGWAIANLHTMLGHDKTAYVLGQDPGDKSQCIICRYERWPTAENRIAVIDALGSATYTGAGDPAVASTREEPA